LTVAAVRVKTEIGDGVDGGYGDFRRGHRVRDLRRGGSSDI
jgi:hypothetical protein